MELSADENSYVRTMKRAKLLAELQARRCEVHIFDPILSSSRTFPTKNWTFYKKILASESKQSKAPGLTSGSEWDLEPLAQIIDRLGHNAEPVTSLLLDLYGAEWQVFDHLLQSMVLVKHFKQVSIRFRLWYGEEYENNQKFFSYFLRMEYQGFKIYNSRILPNDDDAVDGGCANDSCIEIGWINTNLIRA